MPFSEPGSTDRWNPETEAPEADVADQQTPALPDDEPPASEHVPMSSRPPLTDVDEADLLDQEREVPWSDVDRE